MNLAEPAQRHSLIEGLIACSLEAGAEIWRIFEAGFEVIEKADLSPVTVADHAAEAIILKALAVLAPKVPVVAEEEAAAGRIPDVAGCFFSGRSPGRHQGIHPARHGLHRQHRPDRERRADHGGDYAPARQTLYVGDAMLGEAWTSKGTAMPTAAQRRELGVRCPKESPVALASKSHDVPATEAYLRAIDAGNRISVGSSLKFGLLAAGEADIYPRPSPTMEWDTAAGHAVLIAAGGRAFAPDGSPLRYGKTNFFNPGFVAVGRMDDPPALGPFMDAAAPAP